MHSRVWSPLAATSLAMLAVAALVSHADQILAADQINPSAASNVAVDNQSGAAGNLSDKTGAATELPLDPVPHNYGVAPIDQANINTVFQPQCPTFSFGGPADECMTADRSMGYKFTWAADKWCNVGAGVRTSFSSMTQNAPGGGGSFFHIDNMRLYTSGKVHQYVGFEFNTDINENEFVPGNSNQIQLLDAIGKFEFNDYVNVWVGRLLPPSDRANLSGPYFINAWDFPFVQNYTGVFAGRDNGVVYWGQAGGGKLQWSAGVFDGSGRTVAPGELTAPNLNGNVEFAMRTQISLLDPEPGYYKQGSYYGEKDLFVIGYAMQTQNSAVGNATNAQSATEYNFDLLIENKMTDWGSVTIEGAFYHYSSINAAGLSVLNPYVARPGDAGFIYAGWLMPQQVGIGRFRPFVRYLKYNYDNKVAAAAQADNSSGWDLGCEYAIKAQSARLMLFYGERDVVGFGRVNLMRLAAQINF